MEICTFPSFRSLKSLWKEYLGHPSLIFLYIKYIFPGGSEVKNLPSNAGDMGSIPGLGRSPGEGNGSPL